MIYGAGFGVLVLVGIGRLVWRAKGWAWYAANDWVWAKMSVLGVVGLLSIPPTLTFLNWRRAGAARPTPQAVRRIRAVVAAELAVLALAPLFAALMARDAG